MLLLLVQEAEAAALMVKHQQEKAFLQAKCEASTTTLIQLRQHLVDRAAAEQRLVDQVRWLGVWGLGAAG